MSAMRDPRVSGIVLILVGAFVTAGCYNTPVDTSAYERGPAPLRGPSPKDNGACACYEDSVTGGQLFAMYCNYCHNPPSLAERPFSNERNVITHMRIRANLTGKEAAKIMAWLRRWQDVPPGHPPVTPGPKRFIYDQPINELKPKAGEPLTPPATTPPQEMVLPHPGVPAPDSSATGN
jgi:hypothetical protein